MRVVVVGGGIVGTMHALEALDRGHEVVQLERDEAPVSASVRNFGHVLVSGRAPGEELEVALRARRRWAELATIVPDIGFAEVGTLNVALEAAEAKVHEAVLDTDDAARRGFRRLSPDEVRQLEPAIGGRVVSGLFSDADARVEPRRAVHAVRAHLSEAERYDYIGGRAVVAVEEASVVDHTQVTHHADVVLVCPGADHSLLDPSAPLRRCQLQMFETEPLAQRLSVAVTDAGSLRYYPAFAGPAVDALGPADAVAEAWNLQLLVVPRADGRLTVGDTHVYDEPFDFDYASEPEHDLLGRARRIFGLDLPPIRRRWLGVYSQRIDGAVEHREQVSPGVWVVTGLGGRGMTLAPAVAERTFEEIER